MALVLMSREGWLTLELQRGGLAARASIFTWTRCESGDEGVLYFLYFSYYGCTDFIHRGITFWTTHVSTYSGDQVRGWEGEGDVNLRPVTLGSHHFCRCRIGVIEVYL